MISSNSILYDNASGETPDHCVVIKYIPYVGDSKRALDEYMSEIFMGGTNTIVMHNTCEDSLLAAPLILDLVLLAEITGRISMRKAGSAENSPRGSEDTRDTDTIAPRDDSEFEPLHPVNVLLSYLTKAPSSLVPPHIRARATDRRRV